MKSVLITGASSGFGSNAAIALAERGWRVFAAMRDVANADLILQRGQALDVQDRLIPLSLDVTDQRSIDAAVTQILEATDGTLDALLNNAGYSVLGAFEDMDDADCRAQMETNFFGTLAVTRAILPVMRKAQAGRIVIISSNAVNTPHPMLSIYAASKWALEGWAEGLAMEIAPFGVEVRVIQPGAHRTPFARNVQFVSSQESAYRRWFDKAAPSVGELDNWGRDPDLATGPILEAVAGEGGAFRTAVGEDTQIFSALKGSAPYEARAFAVRAIIGAPAEGEFTNRAATEKTDWPIASQILGRIGMKIAQDSKAAEVLARTFKLQKR